ncbi:unnamed protein product [Schistosoma curassoni]|uniref:Reverse transcriptase domain-containing protein n=1 Tax=Schistosoma curassoni TaxID=6186 RepID=A0A183JIC2_9TREM|nr:unnamed protein product [Schistosoma curassoni]
MMPLLTTRAVINLGTWNARIMWEIWRVIQIAAEMKRYNLEVLGISGTHWTKVRQQRLASKELLLYSGREEENAPHAQGVAPMLSQIVQQALIGWESHGSGIFKSEYEGITMNVVQCCATTNDSNDDDKDQFCERLQSIIAKCPGKDLNILMGDLNAKAETDNAGYEDIMEQHGLREGNENVDRFAYVYAFNKLVIGDTVFPHKRIQKTTWTSPDHTTQNQFDHICINKKFRRTMEVVRTKRGCLIKIAKKGDLSKCENYRNITHLSIPGKVFNSVLSTRMKDFIDAQLRDQQAGFREDWSCTDQNATLRIIVEQSIEWNSSLYINFIDYEKGFDSLNRTTLWKFL